MSDLFEAGPQFDAVVIASSGAQRPVRLLVDTGADISMLADSVLADLLSTPEATLVVGGLFSAAEKRAVHVVTLRLLLSDGTTREFSNAFLTAMPAADDGVDGLIGRDMLSFLRFSYDGPAGTFTLTE